MIVTDIIVEQNETWQYHTRKEQHICKFGQNCLKTKSHKSTADLTQQSSEQCIICAHNRYFLFYNASISNKNIIVKEQLLHSFITIFRFIIIPLRRTDNVLCAILCLSYLLVKYHTICSTTKSPSTSLLSISHILSYILHHSIQPFTITPVIIQIPGFHQLPYYHYYRYLTLNH